MIDDEATKRFPQGAVPRLVLLQYGDHPVIEPPGLDPLGADTEIQVAAELARTEAGLGGEGIASWAEMSAAACTSCTVPSIRARSRVGPIPRRTLPVARRLRPVTLAAGGAPTTGLPSQRHQHGTRCRLAPPPA